MYVQFIEISEYAYVYIRWSRYTEMFVAEAAIALTLFVVGISGRPEPPVSQHQGYLPPDQQYGPPQRNGVNSPAGQGYSAFGGASSYARPAQTPPSAPGAPFSTNQYLPPNQQYGAPGAGNRPYDDGFNNVSFPYS